MAIKNTPALTPAPPSAVPAAQRAAADLVTLLRSRHTLIKIETRDERRVEAAIIEAVTAAGSRVRLHDIAVGAIEVDGTPADDDYAGAGSDPSELLRLMRDWLKTNGDDGDKPHEVWVLRDWHRHFGDALTVRGIRTTARMAQEAQGSGIALVLLCPPCETPAELSGQATLIDWPLPDRAEVNLLLEELIEALPTDVRKGVAAQLVNGQRERVVDAALGMSADEIGNCYSLSLVKTRTVDPAIVSHEKRRIIAREKLVEWIEPDPRGLDAIGGNDEVKKFARLAKQSSTRAALDYGCDPLRGLMLIGVPGCGKSLAAKCIATAFGVPLLRLDFGALKSKYVGDSEGNIRRAFKLAETVAPCVLWIDEIEKGVSSGESHDSGVSSDQKGAFLTWMQEKTAPVFVVATANDPSTLPPELLRKGRFDEVFFIDLPNPQERAEVLAVTLRKYKREPSTFDLQKVAAHCEDFSGAELAQLVPSALRRGWADAGRAITADDLVAEAKETVPLAKLAREKIDALRLWAKGRARPASLPLAAAPAVATTKGRKLDISAEGDVSVL